jgi:hypothetical protein
MSNAVYAVTAVLLGTALQGGGGGWFTWTMLAAILLILLLGGVMLLLLGSRDLIRELRQFRRHRAELKNHLR